jgi:NADPH:quinone reductase-like Zn-dependent oxidoreductase
MRAINIRNGKGDASALYIADNVPDPVLKPGYILVRIKAFGLNRMDIMQREDRYPYPLLPESGSILGVEFAGVIEELGEDCKGGVDGKFNVGDRVFGLAYGGAVSYRECLLLVEGEGG